MDPNDVRLLPTERNAIFELVAESGLAASCFEWADSQRFEEPIVMHGVTYTTVSMLVHVPSTFSYKFGKYYDQLFPGVKERVERRDIFKNGLDQKWRYRIEAVRDWLYRLKEEVEAPDLWSEMLQDRRFIQISAYTIQPDEVFTVQDKIYMSQQLEQMKLAMGASHELQMEQVRAIETGFADIVAAMDRFGKKDWLNLAIGTLVNIAVAASFAPSAASDLLHRFIGVVGPLFDAAQKMLPL
jgi:hypothetical protein